MPSAFALRFRRGHLPVPLARRPQLALPLPALLPQQLVLPLEPRHLPCDARLERRQLPRQRRIPSLRLSQPRPAGCADAQGVAAGRGRGQGHSAAGFTGAMQRRCEHRRSAAARRLLPGRRLRPHPAACSCPSSPQQQQLLDEVCRAQALRRQHPHLLLHLGIQQGNATHCFSASRLHSGILVSSRGAAARRPDPPPAGRRQARGGRRQADGQSCVHAYCCPCAALTSHMPLLRASIWASRSARARSSSPTCAGGREGGGRAGS